MAASSAPMYSHMEAILIPHLFPDGQVGIQSTSCVYQVNGPLQSTAVYTEENKTNIPSAPSSHFICFNILLNVFELLICRRSKIAFGIFFKLDKCISPLTDENTELEIITKFSITDKRRYMYRKNKIIHLNNWKERVKIFTIFYRLKR